MAGAENVLLELPIEPQGNLSLQQLEELGTFNSFLLRPS